MMPSCTQRSRIASLLAAAGALFGATGCSMAPRPVADAPLHGSTFALVNDVPSHAVLAPGAAFAPAAGRTGVANGTDFAVEVAVPAAAWGPRGTVAFWFSFDESRIFGKGARTTVPLIETPVFDVCLRGTVLLPQAPAGKSAAVGSSLSNIPFSRFDGGKPYHLAVAWDAEKGTVEGFLNGVSQVSSYFMPWEVGNTSGTLRVGIPSKAGRMVVDSVQYFSSSLDEKAVGALLEGQTAPALSGEGRTLYSGALDLSSYRLTTVYENDFSESIDVLEENSLFDGERRVRMPGEGQWVLEGKGQAWASGGRLYCANSKGGESSHTVLWYNRVFPSDFLVEFDMSPRDAENGLGIVFFAARPKQGGSVFDLSLPRREGVFKNYTNGEVNSYHVSYWAASPETGSRATVNLRKNSGFFLTSMGVERIAGAGEGAGPYRVRILKVGNRIEVETKGEISLVYEDKGETGLPVWGDGYIGLRQMEHSGQCSYGYLRISRVEPR